MIYCQGCDGHLGCSKCIKNCNEPKTCDNCHCDYCINCGKKCKLCGELFCGTLCNDDMNRDCYGCNKHFGNVCDACVKNINDCISITDQIISGYHTVLCVNCFKDFDFAFCALCSGIFKIQDMINNEFDNKLTGLLCVDCDMMKSLQTFNGIEFESIN